MKEGGVFSVFLLESKRGENMVMFGPLQMFVFGFPGNKFKGGILPALDEAREKGIIRFVDYMFVLKDKKGKLTEVEGTDLGDTELVNLGAGIGALMGFGAAGEEGANIGWREGEEMVAESGIGFTKEDMDRVAEDIPKNSSALIMIIEHLWAKDLKQQLMDADAVMLANGMLTRDMFMQIGAIAAAQEAPKKKSTKPKTKKKSAPTKK
jgi:uncharacterized membrane protein